MLKRSLRAAVNAVGALAGATFAVLGRAQTSPASAPSDGAPDDAMWVAVLAGMVLVPLLLWGVRRLLLKRVEQQMMASSADAGSDASDPPQETEAAVIPEFAQCEADLAPPGSSAARARHEARALHLFRRVCLLDLCAALIYAVLPLLFAPSAPGAIAPPGLLLAASIAAFTAIRYLMHRQQFRAFDLSRSRRRQRIYQRLGWVWRGLLVLVTLATGATASNLLYVPDVLRAVVGARMRTWLSIAAVLYAVVQGITLCVEPPEGATHVAGLGLLLAACAHGYLFTVFARRWRDETGIRLLVLRVFNIEATSAFLFSGLMKYWRHFGNHFTVADAALIRQAHSNNTWSTALIVLGGWALLMIFMLSVTHWTGDLTHWSAAVALAAAPSLTAAGAAYRIGRYRVDGRFTRGRDQLMRRLASLEQHPRHFDLSFRHARVLCHDNTWFMAVAEFARRADAVLMDLRGYSPARMGCQKEVDFLFDTVPVQRMLFLIDTGTDEETVRQMLMERWAWLQPTSPNLALQAPVIQLYLSRDNDERDMQAILDRLIEIADAE